MSSRQHETPEELQLKKAISGLRIKLGITAADGFLLTSERSRGLSGLFQPGKCQNRRYVIIQPSFVEAAARLSLFQQFDIHQFDAFCICLRCTSSSDNEDSAPPEYYALCDWLLDICRTLISPALPRFDDEESSTFVNVECDLAREERFPFFQRLICRARIWSDFSGSLFQRLRQVAQVKCLRAGTQSRQRIRIQ
jgi:hypothetical protein